MTEEIPSRLQVEYEQAMAELQHHMERLFRHAGKSPEITRLRLSILNYRLPSTRPAGEDVEIRK